jgi:GNAT superfamily N-acetyltransferase
LSHDVRQGGAADALALLHLFDDAVAWMVRRGRTEQWGSEPFSSSPTRVQRVHDWAAGGGLWLASHPCAGDVAGAIVLGTAPDYVPASEVPELYVEVLLTASACRGRGIGARLVDHALALGRRRGASRLRVDCWAGDPALPAHYERLGFTRIGSFDVGAWPGAILAMQL